MLILIYIVYNLSFQAQDKLFFVKKMCFTLLAFKIYYVILQLQLIKFRIIKYVLKNNHFQEIIIKNLYIFYKILSVKFKFVKYIENFE